MRQEVPASVTDSIQKLIDVTEYRRTRQMEHNEKHGITPQSVKRAVQESLQLYSNQREQADKLERSMVSEDEAVYNRVKVIAELEKEMIEASSRLEFERAAHLRDQIKALKEGTSGAPAAGAGRKPVKYPKGGGRRK